MSSVLSKWRPPLRALNHSSTWLGVGIVVLIWLSMSYHLRADLQATRDGAQRNAQNIARAVEAFTNHAITEIDHMLVFLRAAYERDPEAFRLSDFLRDGKLAGDLTLQVATIDASGFLSSSNLAGGSPRVDLSDREHFRVHTEGRGDFLFVSKPVFGRVSGKPSVQLTRPLRGPDGTFGGVIVASMDPLQLSEFYDAIDFGNAAAITLIGADGVVRALGGHAADQEALGHNVGDFLGRMQREPKGYIYDATGPTERLIAWSAVDDQPLYVKVTVPMDGVLAPYRAKVVRFRAAALAFCGLVLLFVGYGVRRNARLLQAEEALRHSEANARRTSHDLQVTLEHMSQGIMMVDRDGQVQVMNRRATRLLDLPDAFVDERPPFGAILRYQWERGEFGSGGEQLDPNVRDYILSGGLSNKMEVYERRRPNGTVLEVRNTPLQDGGIVRTYTDITERSNTAAALAAARDAAEAAGRARSSFLAMMSHEIRTPLNGIIGMADLILETSLNEEQRRYAGTLRTSAEHLLQIINDVLDFSKLEADRVEFEDVTFDLEETVDAVLDIVAPRAAEKGLFVGAIVDPSLPTQVSGDPAAFRQILLNLAGNAVKFTAKGHVSITVEPRPGAPADDQTHIVVKVRDTGIGIPESAIGSLFREFAQVDGSISRRFGGTGLGLAICRQLVERMGGRIAVSSVEGEGSTFTFELAFRRVPGTQPIGREELADRRILVMATDPVVRGHYVQLLHRLGAWIEPTGRAADAVARLRRAGARPFDAVVVDEATGGQDSAALAEAVRTDLQFAGLRLVLATNASHRLAEGSIHRMAFDRVLGKPVRRKELVDALTQRIEPTLDDRPDEAQSPVPASSRGMILLAEDNPTNRLVIGTLLQKLGYACHAVTNGIEAVEAVQRSRYDLVLMDVMMPDMDGYAATKAIRKLPGETARIPIVALTANVLTSDIKAALAAGMDDYATKPIGRDRLEHVIQKALDRSRPRQERPRTDPAAPAPVEFDGGMLQTLLDEVEPDSARMILDVFIEDTRERLAAMAVATDRTATARQAHAIKSAAATFGLMAVSAKAAALEHSASHLDDDAFARAVSDLTQAFETGLTHLPRAERLPDVA
ncbi:response regulator [Alsobacter sp. R-9]